MENPRTVNYQQILDRLSMVESAVVSNGGALASSRIGQYKRDISRLNDPTVLANLRGHFTEEQLVQLLFTLGEVSELWTIFETLHPRYSTVLSKRLRDILGGPVSAADELDRNTGGRAHNVQFELLLMAQLAHSGLPILDDTLTDVKSRFRDRDLLFECKRPQRSTSVRPCLRDALHQLIHQARNQNAGSLKMVAISLSKVLTEGKTLWKVSDEHEGLALMGQAIEAEMKPHARYFGQQAGPHVAGVIVYATASVLRTKTGSPGNVSQQVFFANPDAEAGVERDALEWFGIYESGKQSAFAKN